MALYTTIKHLTELPENWEKQHLELRIDTLALSMSELINIGKNCLYPPVFSNREQPMDQNCAKQLGNIGICDIDFRAYQAEFSKSKQPIIISWHDNATYPRKLPAIQNAIFKICPKFNDMPSCLRFLTHMQKFPSKHIIAYARGERFQFTRQLAIAQHQPIHFLRPKLADNVDSQLTIDQVPKQTKASHWFALLGQNISHSLSPDYHNQWLLERNLPGLYFLLDIKPDELEDCWDEIQNLPFAGFSVTTPHKQAIARLANSHLPILNTMTNHQGQWHTFNTDTLAFLELQKPYESILILGAGAAATAIAGTVQGNFNIWSRPSASLSSFIKMFKNARPLQQADYDLIVSTLPGGIQSANLPKLRAKQFIELQYSHQSIANISYESRISGQAFFNQQAAIQQKIFMNVFD